MIKIYEMEMKFELTLGFRSLNNMLEDMGFNEKPYVKGQTIILKQELPVVPDTAYISKIEETIKATLNKSNTSDIEVKECKFVGYKKFIEKEIKKEA